MRRPAPRGDQIEGGASRGLGTGYWASCRNRRNAEMVALGADGSSAFILRPKPAAAPRHGPAARRGALPGSPTRPAMTDPGPDAHICGTTRLRKPVPNANNAGGSDGGTTTHRSLRTTGRTVRPRAGSPPQSHELNNFPAPTHPSGQPVIREPDNYGTDEPVRPPAHGTTDQERDSGIRSPPQRAQVTGSFALPTGGSFVVLWATGRRTMQ